MRLKVFKKIMVLIVLLIGLFYFLTELTLFKQNLFIKEAGVIPSTKYALILGTVVREKEISPLLKERLDTGYLLLEEGIVSRLILSNTQEASNVMKGYLLTQGVLEDQILIDDSAEYTIDSCLYLKDHSIQSALLVTQGFHLNRALYLCRSEGLEVIGVDAKTYLSHQSEWSLLTIFIKAKRFLQERVLLSLYWIHLY